MSGEFHAVDFDFSYYGHSDQAMAAIDRNLAKLAATGIKNVRTSLSWAEMEPTAPAGSQHNYVFSNFDKWVGLAAKHGIRVQAMFGYTPSWATDSNWCRTLDAHSARPVDINNWRWAVEALAQRYGRGGSFWQNNPGLSARPITHYEIWNEPNLHWYWCPAPQPEIYASFLYWANREISEADPAARVITGGVTLTSGQNPNSSVTPADFLRRVFTTAPSLLNQVDGIGIHPYAFGDRAHQLEAIVLFREQLRSAGVPDSMPMYATEIGWPGRGTPSFSENERGVRLAAAAITLPRVNCNVASVAAFEWISREQDSSKFDDWFGIASPATGDAYPSGLAYAHAIKLMRGELAEAAPRSAVMACSGMPKPDQDHDGTPDESDNFPLDPTRPAGGGIGDGGGGTSGDGGSNQTRVKRCSGRMASLRARVVAATGDERREAKRAYARVSRRCVPCHRKISRLKRAARRADGARARSLSARLSLVTARCAPCRRNLRRLERRINSAPNWDLRAALLAEHKAARRACRIRG